MTTQILRKSRYRAEEVPRVTRPAAVSLCLTSMSHHGDGIDNHTTGQQR
jgi:hypothetical protein